MRKLLHCFNKLCSAISGYLIMVIMILSILDLSLRNLNISVLGILELSILIVVAAIFLGLGYCEEKDGHVRVTLLLDRLPPKTSAGLRVINTVIALIAVAFLTYACGRAAWKAYLGGNAVMAGDIYLYSWPTRLVMVISLGAYTIQILFNLYKELSNFLSGKPSRSPLTEEQ